MPRMRVHGSVHYTLALWARQPVMGICADPRVSNPYTSVCEGRPGEPLRPIVGGPRLSFSETFVSRIPDLSRLASATTFFKSHNGQFPGEHHVPSSRPES